MSQKLYCDRCKREINFGNEGISDFLRQEYPARNICVHCDLEIFLATQLTKRDAELGVKAGTSLKLMAEIYGEDKVNRD